LLDREVAGEQGHRVRRWSDRHPPVAASCPGTASGAPSTNVGVYVLGVLLAGNLDARKDKLFYAAQAQEARAAGGGKVKDPDTIALEKRVSDALGLAVTVSHRDPGGSVQISYRNLEQLDEVMRRLAKGG
jgi:hypothetical protein